MSKTDKSSKWRHVRAFFVNVVCFHSRTRQSKREFKIKIDIAIDRDREGEREREEGRDRGFACKAR